MAKISQTKCHTRNANWRLRWSKPTQKFITDHHPFPFPTHTKQAFTRIDKNKNKIVSQNWCNINFLSDSMHKPKNAQWIPQRKIIGGGVHIQFSNHRRYSNHANQNQFLWFLILGGCQRIIGRWVFGFNFCIESIQEKSLVHVTWTNNVNYLLFTQQTFVNKSNDPMVGKNPIWAIPLIQWKIVDRIKLKEEIKNRSKKKKKRERLRDSAAVLEFALNLESVLGVGG